MNFKRGQEPMDSLKIGIEANCVEIYRISYIHDLSYKNIRRILKMYESGEALKWNPGTRNLFENSWNFETINKGWRDYKYYTLAEFSGMRIQYKGIYYKIPKL